MIKINNERIKHKSSVPLSLITCLGCDGMNADANNIYTKRDNCIF